MNKQANAGGSAHSPEFRRKRIFYLMIPVLVLPFLTMAFWALGGGKGRNGSEPTLPKGLDLVLPSAQFSKKEARSKLAIYQAGGKDSTQTRDGVSKAFVQALGFHPEKITHPDSAAVNRENGWVPQPTAADRQSQEIEARLAQINRQLHTPATSAEMPEEAPAAPVREIRRLHRMMRVTQAQPEADPEMRQLNQMLTRIQAIQHPEEAAKIRPQRKPGTETAFRAIQAVVEGKQKVKSGGTVRLKLTDSVRLHGVVLRKGQLVYGACQLTNQRLLLSIQNVRVGKDIVPVDLTVFSLDGMPGIPAPEAELAGAAGEGAGNAVSGMQFLSMDQSLGSQAAIGGINAAKGLLGKKVRKIKVKLRDGLPVLLRNNGRR